MIAITLLTGSHRVGTGRRRLVSQRRVQFGTWSRSRSLLARVYGPDRVAVQRPDQVMTELVSFDRVFRGPRPGAAAQGEADAAVRPAATPPGTRVHRVRTGVVPIPDRREVSSTPWRRSAQETEGSTPPQECDDISFTAPAGEAHRPRRPVRRAARPRSQLVARMYDPNDGAVSIGGHDIREVTLERCMTSSASSPRTRALFHDTIRDKPPDGRPTAQRAKLVEACKARRSGTSLSVLPRGSTRSSAKRLPASGGEEATRCPRSC